MKAPVILALAALMLVGCQKKEAAAAVVGAKAGPSLRARFVAVGIYSPAETWTQVVGTAVGESPPGPGPGPGPALPADDDEILVVLDSATGEIRQCGNLSGRCLAMNPWAQAIDPRAVAPTMLLKHAAQLKAEAQAAGEPEQAER